MFRKIFPFFLLLVGLFSIYLLNMTTASIAWGLVAEGGLVETLTAITFLIGAIVCFWRHRLIKRKETFWLELGIIFFAVCIRELDPHRIIPNFDFLRKDFYMDVNIPLYIRVLFGFSLANLFGVFLHFTMKNFPLFINAFRKQQTWTFFALAFLVTEILACVKHELVEAAFINFLSVPPDELGHLVRIWEEPLELVAAILFFLTTLQIPWERNQNNTALSAKPC